MAHYGGIRIGTPNKGKLEDGVCETGRQLLDHLSGEKIELWLKTCLALDETLMNFMASKVAVAGPPGRMRL